MENKEFLITLKCLFCQNSFPENACDLNNPEDELIKCESCGESSLKSAVIEVATEEGKEQALVYAKSELEKSIKKFFK